MAWLKLKHPSGRVTIKKFKTKKKGQTRVRIDYYDTAHHFNTEAMVMKVYKKKPSKKERKRR